MLTRKTVLLLKIESTYRTDAVPSVSADEIECENPQWSIIGRGMAARDSVRETLARKQSLHAGELMQISFDAEIKASGSLGVAPEIGQALRACAMSETINAGVDVVYEPTSNNQESATIYFYRDGKRFIITGARGTCVLNMNVGQVAKASFTFTGHLVDETDQALPTPVYSSEVPEVMVGLASLAFDSETPAATAISFDLGNEVAQPEDIVQSNGYGEVRVSNRAVAGSVDFEDKLVADYDFLGKWRADTTFAIDSGVIGASGSQFRVQCGAAYWSEQSVGDRSGIATRQMGFMAIETSGDDEITITFS